MALCHTHGHQLQLMLIPTPGYRVCGRCTRIKRARRRSHDGSYCAVGHEREIAADVLWLLDERERLTDALRDLDEFASNKAGYWQHPLTVKARASLAAVEGTAAEDSRQGVDVVPGAGRPRRSFGLAEDGFPNGPPPEEFAEVSEETHALFKAWVEGTAATPGDACQHDNHHFDRSICACGVMHHYCDDCGKPLEPCVWR